MTSLPWRFRDYVLVLIVLTTAGGTRAWYLSECTDQGWSRPRLEVQGSGRLDGPDKKDLPRGRAQATEVDHLVHHLTQERWFAGPAPLHSHQDEATAHVAPGYYYLFALANSWLDTAEADQVVRWTQAGLGTLTALCYFFFARRVFASRLAAILTGLLCSVHPFWIINTAELNDGVLATFLLAGCLVLGTRASQLGGPMTSLAFGLGLAGLAMVRAALLPFAAIALLWFLLCCRKLPRGWLCALLAFLGFANGLAPWTVRNLQEFGELVPVADSAYLHLWIGNNHLATGGPMDEATLQQTLSAKHLDELRQEDNQARRYHMLARDVAGEITRDPGGTLTRRLWAGLCFLFGETGLPPQRSFTATSTVAPENLGELPDWLAQLQPGILGGALLAMILLAPLGWRWSYGWRKPARLATLAMVCLPFPYLLSHAEALSGPRLPLDGVLLCFTAFAVACFLPGGRRLARGAKEEKA